jgi:hypothetical protein
MTIPDIPFIQFSKIARLSREIIVSEKIDGTNAQVFIPDLPTGGPYHDEWEIFAGSRAKWITPTDDNMGFAKWVERNRDELLRLGPGSHFGEWWGQGIQRNYGLKEKRFSLFNIHRWGPDETRPKCCGVVPVLYRGPFEMEAIDEAIGRLRIEGSVAAPGFLNPEGVVIFHVPSQYLFKKTIDGDAQPKSLAK